MEFSNNVWCFMKLRTRTLHFWSVFVFTNQPNGIVDHKPQDNTMIYDTKPQCFGNCFGWLFECIFEDLSSDLGTEIPFGWLVNTKTLQKWRVRVLSFIKHQKLLKNSTWAWSYVNLKKVPFFFTQNLCFPLKSWLT